MSREWLQQNRTAIQQAWIRQILDGYHTRTQQFLSTTDDPFDNPVGAAAGEATSAILDHLIEGTEPAVLKDAIQQFVRVRAVQDFTCGQAIGFVFELKRSLRDRMGRRKAEQIEHLLALETAIDEVAVVCFESFVEAREELLYIQNRSIRRETHKLVERMNRMSEKLREATGVPSEEEETGLDA